MVQRRKRKSRFAGLVVDSSWNEEPVVIKKCVEEYFKKIYTEDCLDRPSFSSTRFKSLPVDEIRLLENPFTDEEVWSAIRLCGSLKAPGPNGFNFKFIKRFWDIIKEDVLKEVHGFRENESISRGCNASFVTLIPKSCNSTSLGDFRPISLIGSFYKIITKLLAERIKKVIGSLIREVQSTFIGGRAILDGVLIANEVVDFKKSKKKSLIFKVDFEKAYDCINWEFLFSVMEQMGFGRKWR